MSNANGLEHSNRFSFLVPSIGAEPGVPTLARLRRAPTMPLGRILLGDLLRLETKALCLLVAIVIADRAVDAGALRRHAYVLAALAGCVVGELFTTPFGWAWDAYVMSARRAAIPVQHAGAGGAALRARCAARRADSGWPPGTSLPFIEPDKY